MAFDLPPVSKLWLPAKPAILRPAPKPSAQLVARIRRGVLFPVIAPAVKAASRVRQTPPSDISGSSASFTYSSVPFGTPSGTSLVVCIAYAWNNGASGSTITGGSIGGTGATLLVNPAGVFAGSSDSACAIFYLATANTSGTVVVSLNNSMGEGALEVYRLNDLVSATPYNSATTNTPGGSNGTSLSTTINIPDAGILLMGVATYLQASTPSGATQDNTHSVNTVGKAWAGSNQNLTAQSGKSLSATFASTTGALAAGSWH
jgi:hypothetical protein